MTPDFLLPNFFVIGASRSGTTALYHLLRNHPQVYLPRLMEPRFFAFEGDPMAYRGPGDDLLANRVVTDLTDYAALYEGVRDEIAIGEVTPAYLSVDNAAERIRRYCPKARIIAVLRNPVERAISSFRLERLDGWEPLECLGEALREEDTRHRAGWSYIWRYRDRGRYFQQLTRYFDLFPSSSIRIYIYEDWLESKSLPVKIFEFLGLSEELQPEEVSVRHNATSVDRFHARGMQRFEPTPELIADLVEGYRDDILRLEQLIRRDLSAWLAC
jgi:hypothetical protein